MIRRNYNGNVNRTVIRDLKKLCAVNERNEMNLFEAFAEKGEVSVYEDLDPILGCPDELSTVVTLRDETGIKEYLKKDLIKRVDEYLSYQKTPIEDYLLVDLVKYIKENQEFPWDNVMKQLEKEAEAKRVANLPTDTITTPKEITWQDISKEILELAEEIFEARRETKPDDIIVHVEPYDDELLLDDDNFSMTIRWKRYYSDKDSRDYSCIVFDDDANSNIANIYFYYCSDGTIEVNTQFWLLYNTELSVNTLLSVHKFIVKMAKAEGIEFTSEIDYEKFHES